MKTFLKIFLLASVVALSGCAIPHSQKEVGAITEKTISVQDYKHINVSGACKVVLTNAKQGKIHIIAGEKIISDISVKSENDKLKVSFEKLNNYNFKGTTLYIPAQEVKSLVISGMVGVVSENPLIFEDVSLDLSGASSFDMEFTAKNLITTISGAGSLTLKGTCDTFNLECSGSASVQANKLITQNTRFHISGACGVSLHCQEAIAGDVSGVSSVTIYGNPKRSNIEKSGVSSVRFR